MVDASATGAGTVLIQGDNKDQMQFNSYIFRLLTEND